MPEMMARPTVRGTGGTGLYSYEWFVPSDPNTILGTDSTLSGVPGDRYLVRVRAQMATNVYLMLQLRFLHQIL